jgi:hypothetical protein
MLQYVLIIVPFPLLSHLVTIAYEQRVNIWRTESPRITVVTPPVQLAPRRHIPLDFNFVPSNSTVSMFRCYSWYK